MALFDKINGTTPPAGATKPSRMTQSSLFRSALNEPNKTQTYNPRRAEMDLFREKDLATLKPMIEDLFDKLGQAFANTKLASKISTLNTLKQQIMKIINDDQK